MATVKGDSGMDLHLQAMQETLNRAIDVGALAERIEIRIAGPRVEEAGLTGKEVATAKAPPECLLEKFESYDRDHRTILVHALETLSRVAKHVGVE